jgi:hypothetical protein
VKFREGLDDLLHKAWVLGETPTPEFLAEVYEAAATAAADNPADAFEWARDRYPVCPLVYYLKVGNRIKIGFSAHLDRRLQSLPVEEVLGWEPGDRSLEAHRHRQFREHRTAREWFKDCPEIRAHVQGTEGYKALNP